MSSLRSGFYVRGYLIGPGAYLASADFWIVDLSGVDLSGADLTGADVGRADLRGADLSGSSLTGADLRSADLTGADLRGADLSGARLRDADLSGARLSGVSSGNIVGIPSALPTNWSLINGYFVGPGANLSGLDLSGIDLSGIDLSGVDLSGVSSGNIVGIPLALPTSWSLINKYLIGPGANLTDADLRGADLRGADLMDADLTGADLTDADLFDAELIDADLIDAVLTDADLMDAKLIRADLSGADLTGADLFYADLRRADLTNADLSGSDLNGVRSGRIRGTPLAMPTGWELVNGHLFESSATTYKIASTNSSYQVDTDGSVSVNDSAPIECEHTIGETYTLTHVKDSDGNYHGGNKDFDTPDAYQYQGVIDVNGDGLYESIYTNQNSGRWVTASIDTLTGICDYSKYESGDTTRVVGVYEDPNVTTGTVEKGSPLDSSYTLQKDLELNNLILKGAGDYDGDGFQELYWSKVDNTAYCHMLMHADGNIQYANYQNLDQMTDYLTSHGFADTVALIA